MLNRRQIRVRAMQALYAHKQAKGANFQLSKDYIAEQFLPDLNSMEYQDKEKLEGKKKLCTMIFEESHNLQKSEEDFETPAELKNTLMQAELQYRDRNKKDFANYKLKAIKEVDKVYDHYIAILHLFLSIAKAAEEDPKLTTKSNLSKNKILIELARDEELQHQILKRSISFEEEDGLVSKFYRHALKTNAKYEEYCDRVNHTAEEELGILKYLIKNIILKNELSLAYFERDYIYFGEDKETLRSMTVHTFNPYLNGQAVKVIELDDEWQEKKDFMLTLYTECIENEKELLELIMPKLKNWEYDRIADTDKILLRMAVVEMMNFPSIPVKVTINEIIEISKSYSTPRSGQFINGVLDTLSKELVDKGIVKKSGRGMLDNK
jgi:transcription antitermination protein NusB